MRDDQIGTVEPIVNGLNETVKVRDGELTEVETQHHRAREPASPTSHIVRVPVEACGRQVARVGVDATERLARKHVVQLRRNDEGHVVTTARQLSRDRYVREDSPRYPHEYTTTFATHSPFRCAPGATVRDLSTSGGAFAHSVAEQTHEKEDDTQGRGDEGGEHDEHAEIPRVDAHSGRDDDER